MVHIPLETPPTETKGRNQGLDLLRATAIALVIVAHAGELYLAPGANLPRRIANICAASGVDLFFALSGFLIGTILIRTAERAPTMAAWWNFMVRRWMRTLPIYWLWIGVLAITTHESARVIFVYICGLQNFAWPTFHASFFPVSWTLTIEEAFYFYFSLFLLLLASRVGATMAVLLASCFFLAFPQLARVAFMLVHYHPSADYGPHATDFVVLHIDNIVCGVLIAWFDAYQRKFLTRFRMAFFSAGIAMLGFMYWVLWKPGFDWPWFYTPALTAGMALLIPAAWAVKIPNQFLSAIIAYISTRSYAAYIVHLSMLDVARHFLAVTSKPATIFTMIAGTAALAEFSYRVIESPILKRRPTAIA